MTGNVLTQWREARWVCRHIDEGSGACPVCGGDLYEDDAFRVRRRPSQSGLSQPHSLLSVDLTCLMCARTYTLAEIQRRRALQARNDGGDGESEASDAEHTNSNAAEDVGTGTGAGAPLADVGNAVPRPTKRFGGYHRNRGGGRAL